MIDVSHGKCVGRFLHCPGAQPGFFKGGVTEATHQAHEGPY